MNGLPTLSFPRLNTVVRDFKINDMTSLINVQLPVIQTIGDDGSGNSLTFNLNTDGLVTFNIGSSLKSVTKNVTFTSCALNVTSVNNLLIALAALNGTGGTTLYTGNTVTITGTSATPTGAGLTAKATLIAAGNTVTTN